MCCSIDALGQLQRTPKTNSSRIEKIQPSEGHNRKNRIRSLNLTKLQKQQLKEFKAKNKEAKVSIENNASLTNAEKMASLKDLKKANLQFLRSILTPEQLEKINVAKWKRRSIT